MTTTPLCATNTRRQEARAQEARFGICVLGRCLRQHSKCLSYAGVDQFLALATKHLEKISRIGDDGTAYAKSQVDGYNRPEQGIVDQWECVVGPSQIVGHVHGEGRIRRCSGSDHLKDGAAAFRRYFIHHSLNLLVILALQRALGEETRRQLASRQRLRVRVAVLRFKDLSSGVLV